MPVKLGSKLPEESAEARIEIVPLIDIMFFLLAAFMLVSLSMVNLKSVKVNLPTAVAATPDTASTKDTASLSVDRAGGLWLDQKPVGENELQAQLASLKQANPKFRVMISADAEVPTGKTIRALDLARRAGIEQVAFETKTAAAPAGKETPK